MRKKRTLSRALFILAVAAGSLAYLACSDDSYNDYPTGDALPKGDGAQRDAALPDAIVLPDRITDPDGPEITILKPTTSQIVSGNQMTVEARITDDDSEVDPSSVKAYVTADESHPMGREAAGSNIYKGIVNISELGNGPQTLVVVASDLQGKTNSAEVSFQKDLGPTITFFSPEDTERYVDSANLSFEVRDGDGLREDSVSAIIGTTEMDITKTGEDDGTPKTWITYNYNIVFDDSIFNPPLRGSQMIQVSAENSNNTKSTSSVTFVIDQEGPDITVNYPGPGEIVGGIMDIEVSVSDEAGILTSSVVAVLAGNQTSQSVTLQPSGAYFTASFDTRVFPDTYVFPSLSVRAADTLGNESDVGFLVALDNQPPIASLDPPENLRMAQQNADKNWECSWEFDPVGEDAANAGDTVPQVFWLRARVEDQGNVAQGLLQQRPSLVDYSTVKLYVLQDTENYPLVVDTDDDGFCDEINPDLIPSTTPTESDEVLVLNLVPIPPTGDADFRYEENADLPVGCDSSGIASDIPSDLCTVTPMTVSIFYTVDPQEPAIYSLEPVDSSNSLFCTGNQFDALANNIAEGWTCAAVRAVDRLGNIGVSEPTPVCIDYTLDGSPSECHQSTPDVPDCTGTQNPISLEVSMDPCTFHGEKQLFRNRQVRRIP